MKKISKEFTHCFFDNPVTMCRESWTCGELDSFISAQLLLQKNFQEYCENIPKWSPGKVYGDAEALPIQYRQEIDDAQKAR